MQPISVGEVVLVEVGNHKRKDWITLVQKTFPSVGGIIRSVELRTLTDPSSDCTHSNLMKIDLYLKTTSIQNKKRKVTTHTLKLRPLHLLRSAGSQSNLKPKVCEPLPPNIVVETPTQVDQPNLVPPIPVIRDDQQHSHQRSVEIRATRRSSRVKKPNARGPELRILTLFTCVCDQTPLLSSQPLILQPL